MEVFGVIHIPAGSNWSDICDIEFAVLSQGRTAINVFVIRCNFGSGVRIDLIFLSLVSLLDWTRKLAPLWLRTADFWYPWNGTRHWLLNEKPYQVFGSDNRYEQRKIIRRFPTKTPKTCSNTRHGNFLKDLDVCPASILSYYNLYLL